jgi:hypothetical protein
MIAIGTLLVGVAAIIVAAVMGLYVHNLSVRDADDREQASTLIDLATRLARIEGVVDAQAPFFASIQSHVIDLLHHPDIGSERFDLLLEHLKAKTLTTDQKHELVDMLKDMAKNPKDEAQAKGAVALLMLMPKVEEEALDNMEASDREALEPVRPTTNTQPRRYVRQADAAIAEMARLTVDTNEKVTAIKAALEGENHHAPTLSGDATLPAKV